MSSTKIVECAKRYVEARQNVERMETLPENPHDWYQPRGFTSREFFKQQLHQMQEAYKDLEEAIFRAGL